MHFGVVVDERLHGEELLRVCFDQKLGMQRFAPHKQVHQHIKIGKHKIVLPPVIITRYKRTAIQIAAMSPDISDSRRLLRT
jgi:hypothetical protein